MIAGAKEKSKSRKRQTHKRSVTRHVTYDATPTPTSTPAPTPTQVPTPTPTPTPSGPPPPAPKVVLAPAKPKVRVLIVPKHNKAKPTVKKTFRAKRVVVVMDNTAKTIKRRGRVAGLVAKMSDEQVRAGAIAAGLTTPDSKAPISLLRKMLEYYHRLRTA